MMAGCYCLHWYCQSEAWIKEEGDTNHLCCNTLSLDNKPALTPAVSLRNPVALLLYPVLGLAMSEREQIIFLMATNFRTADNILLRAVVGEAKRRHRWLMINGFSKIIVRRAPLTERHAFIPNRQQLKGGQPAHSLDWNWNISSLCLTYRRTV